MTTAIQRTTSTVPVAGSDIPSPPSEDGAIGSSSEFMRKDAVPSALPMCIWRLVSNVVNDANPLGSGGSDWEVTDDTENETYLGTLVTESSGVFSFPSTGKWSIRFYGVHDADTSADTQAILNLVTTDDNTTYNTVAQIKFNAYAVNVQQSGAGEALINVSNITLDKVKLVSSLVAAGNSFRGLGTSNMTYIIFEKKADL